MYSKGKIKISFPVCCDNLEDWDGMYNDENLFICEKCGKHHRNINSEAGHWENKTVYLPHS